MPRYKESKIAIYASSLAYEMRMDRFMEVVHEDVVRIHQIGYVELPRCKETKVENQR